MMAALIWCLDGALYVGELSTSYLGSPLQAPNKHCGVGDSNEEKLKRKLVAWKKLYLSKGRNLVLIKNTLSSNLPIYFMSLFAILKKVWIKLERIQRNFLWGDTRKRRKIHLVNWPNVCADKKHGGLGLRGLVALKEALLGKW